MNASIFHTLSQMVLFLETASHHDKLRDALTGAGFGAEALEEGYELLANGEEAIEQVVLELQDDSTCMHLIHGGAVEQEQWFDTALFRIRKLDDDTRTLLAAHDVHYEAHTLTVVARTLRFLAVMRNDEGLRAQIGSERSVADLLQRGKVILTKLIRMTTAAITPRTGLTKAAVILDPAHADAKAWLEAAHAAALDATDDPRLLGALGLLTQQADPLGGTALNVTRHERTNRMPPGTGPSPAAPGWSLGRQGQNGRNNGKGW